MNLFFMGECFEVGHRLLSLYLWSLHPFFLKSLRVVYWLFSVLFWCSSNIIFHMIFVLYLMVGIRTWTSWVYYVKMHFIIHLHRIIWLRHAWMRFLPFHLKLTEIIEWNFSVVLGLWSLDVCPHSQVMWNRFFCAMIRNCVHLSTHL